MSFFKKPAVAVIIALILVVMGTFASVNVKLGDKCQEVTDGFYTGKLWDGTQESSISAQLDILMGLADDLESVAASYGADVEDVSDSLEYTRYALLYSRNDISYVYYNYDELVRTMKALIAYLASADLSQQDKSTVDEISAGISAAQEVIRNSDYNESVRTYLLSYNRFPTNLLGEFANVHEPEYFS